MDKKRVAMCHRTRLKALAAGLALCGLIVQNAAAQAEHGYKDGVYFISLDVIRQELGKAGRYPASSEVASEYYSDFFGLQRIRDLSLDEVVKALVPSLAEISAPSPVLKLRFAKGFTAVFYLDAELAMDGSRNGFRRSFVECVDYQPAFKDRYEALAEFLRGIDGAGLQRTFLEPNPYAALEKIAAADLRSDTRARPTGWPQLTPEERAKEKTEALAAFERSKHAILMFGDTHGSEESYGAVWDFLSRRDKAPGFDWLGLEMLTVDLQPVLDTYFSSSPGSSEFQATEAKLRDILKEGWDKRFKQAVGPDGEGHYFRLVRWARSHKIRVYALDAVADYNFFRYGEFPLGATTRNIIWAEALPKSGKGVVYGGSAHFVPLPATPFTFQDFMKRKDPAVGLFLVR